MTDRQVPALLMTKVVKFAMHTQLDLQPLTELINYDPNPQCVHQESVSLEVFCQVVEQLMQQDHPDCPGLFFADSFAFEYLPEMETFLATSDTPIDALEVFKWVGPLLIPFADFEAVGSDHEWGLQIALNEAIPESIQPVIIEAATSVICKFGKLLLADAFCPSKVEFRHGPQGEEALYHQQLKAPVHFSCTRNTLWVDPKILSQPLKNPMPTMHRQAADALQQRLDNLQPASSLAREIYRLIHDEEAYLLADIQVFANLKGMTVRTLQRQLRAEDTSFRKISEQAKASLACEYLKNAELSIEDISDKLGFSDRRSFSRSFSRWLKETPSAYRKRLSPD